MKGPPKFVIHINFLPGSLLFEPTRIWTALRRAEHSGKITPAIQVGLEQSLGQTALYLAARDYILRTAVKELKGALTLFADLLPEPWKIPEIDANGVRYRVVHGKDVFQARDRVLLAVDSFLFEFRAYLELLATYVYGILVGIGQGPSSIEKLGSGESVRITNGKKFRTHEFLRYLCGRLCVDTHWYEFLVRHRNFFTHTAAPYIAIEDRGVRPPEFDFLIMRVNIHDFAHADPADYFRLSECQSVMDGVRRLAHAVQDFLVKALEP